MDKTPILNKVKQRYLVLSPTVKSCLEREACKSDFSRLDDKPAGKGGFGEVWKVVHKVTKKVYCIKMISKRSILDSNMIDQMNREIEIMYKLNHPHIVKLINHFEDDDSFCLVMNYASKGQLFNYLKKAGRFDQKSAAQYLRETINALQFLHSFNPPIIHRDLKPENILLDENFRVKLADFGWSNYLNDHERKTYCGTAEYLAPEMLYKTGHDTSVDIWSVGVLMFELLTGRSPFVATSQQELFNNIKRLKINWPLDFPHLAKNLITKFLKQNPKDRISLEESLNHIWFEQNPPIYKPLDFPSSDPKTILESHLLSVKSETIQSEINKIVEKISSLRTTRNTIMGNQNIVSGQAQIKNNSGGFTQEINQNIKSQSNSTSNALEQQINSLTKLNNELKTKCESTFAELVKIEQLRSKDTLTIKKLEQDNSLLKLELDKYVSFNKARIESLAELEQKSITIIEKDCRIKTLTNEISNLNFNIENLTTQIDELKSQNNKLEEKHLDFKKRFYELRISKEDAINEYREKIELLQSRLFDSTKLVSTNSNSTVSTGIESSDSLVEILNDNVIELKKVFNSKVMNIMLMLNEIKEEFSNSEKSIKGIIEKKSEDIGDMLNKLSKRIEEEVSLFMSTNDRENLNQASKTTKENWLSEQVHELQPYKTKYMSLELKLKKAESEIEILKSKCITYEDIINECKKDNDFKTEEYKKSMTEQKNLEAKFSDMKDFVYKFCPNKLDEFKKIL